MNKTCPVSCCLHFQNFCRHKYVVTFLMFQTYFDSISFLCTSWCLAISDHIIWQASDGLVYFELMKTCFSVVLRTVSLCKSHFWGLVTLGFLKSRTLDPWVNTCGRSFYFLKKIDCWVLGTSFCAKRSQKLLHLGLRIVRRILKLSPVRCANYKGNKTCKPV